MTYNIKISDPQAAQKLNQIATRYSYDIWVHGQSGMADAKSILGLMLFTLEKDLKLVVDDGVDTKSLEKDISDFLA
jgi:phosphotransferase system HPr-like phosphotransfer protein